MPPKISLGTHLSMALAQYCSPSGIPRFPTSDNRRDGIHYHHIKGHFSHTLRLRARDQYTLSTLIGGNGGAGGSSSLPSHFAWESSGVSMWMQDGCKSLHGFLHCIKWIMFHGHLVYFQEPPLGGRPNTNHRETMALRTLTTVRLLYFIMCEDPHEWEFSEIVVGWGPGHIWLHTTLEAP